MACEQADVGGQADFQAALRPLGTCSSGPIDEILSQVIAIFPAPVSNAIFSAILLPLVLAAVCGAACSWFLARPLKRLPKHVHWSEKARHLMPLRSSAALTPIWIVTVASLVSYDSLTARSGIWLLVLIGISAAAGCLLGSREITRTLDLPPAARSGGWRAFLSRLILFPNLPAMLLVVALTWSRGLDAIAVGIAAFVFLVCVALALGGGIAILRTVGLAKPVDPTLQRSCHEMAASHGVAVRHVMCLDLGMANAFAFPWTKDLAFTNALLTALDEDELRSVVAHELGHLAEGGKLRSQRLFSFLSIPTVGLAPSAVNSDQPLWALGLFGLYWLIARWVSQHHKRLEIEADASAVESQTNPGVYASALEKIHAASLIPAVLDPRYPYPSLYDRMVGAGRIPDFPRPKPPHRWLAIVSSGITALVFLGLWQWLGV